ncbi:MAG: hypothetical protein K9M49_03350 [Candidatus Marinimicrobia bacterium]|nr:hypothetical protein [Candidatus Neomarinimicrobiota bacterium]MCF7904170.1 hypothetical protein [Candidatus Neomarinimicrobiota bacterium]
MAHFTALILELKNLLQAGSLKLLAPAPLSGWSPHELNTLIILGTLDMCLIIGLAGYGWMLYRERRQARRLGLLVLSSFQITALVYAMVIIPSGAIATHPITYMFITIAFMPVLMLWLVLLLNKRK